MGVFKTIDAWSLEEALRHYQARQKGNNFRGILPGLGFFKFFVSFIILPLVASEIMFFLGFPALPVPAVILVLFGILAVFYWRYFAQLKAIKAKQDATSPVFD